MRYSPGNLKTRFAKTLDHVIDKFRIEPLSEVLAGDSGEIRSGGKQFLSEPAALPRSLFILFLAHCASRNRLRRFATASTKEFIPLLIS